MHLILTLALASAGPLTLPEARRATDRAFRTELAGDHEGAIRALDELLATSVDPAQASARAHIAHFLDGLRRRRDALADGSPGAEHRAMATLRDAPAAWRRLYWSALLGRRPGLEDRLAYARVRVTVARTAGLDAEAVEARLGAELTELGVRPVDQDETHRVRFDLDASDRSEVRHRIRARATGAYVLTEVGVEGPPKSGFVETESERADGARAQHLAERRLVDGLIEEVGFELRLWALRVSPPEAEPERP